MSIISYSGHVSSRQAIRNLTIAVAGWSLALYAWSRLDGDSSIGAIEAVVRIPLFLAFPFFALVAHSAFFRHLTAKGADRRLVGFYVFLLLPWIPKGNPYDLFRSFPANAFEWAEVALYGVGYAGLLYFSTADRLPKWSLANGDRA